MIPPGQKGRDDFCVTRSARNIAANTRTALRERPSRVASVRQDPNSAAPGVRSRSYRLIDVRFGSKADMCSALADVR